MDLVLLGVFRASVQNQDTGFHYHAGQMLKEAEGESLSEFSLLVLPPQSLEKNLFCLSACPTIAPRVQGNKCKPKYS